MIHSRSKQFVTIRICSFVIVLTILILFGHTKILASEDISLQVSPAVATIDLLAPGDEKIITYSLSNHSDHPEIVTLRTFPIKSVDKKTNRLIYQSNREFSAVQQSFYENAISFIEDEKIITTVTIPPKHTREIKAKVTYNPDQSISEYYMTIGFLTEPAIQPLKPTDDQIQAEIILHGGVGSHLLVSLGDKSPQVSIGDVHTQLNTSAIPHVSFELKNHAEKYTKIYGNVSITNILGIQIASFDTPDIYLLGSQTKHVSFTPDEFQKQTIFTKLLSLGPNTLTVELENTDNNTRIASISSYTYLPVHDAFVLIGILFLSIILIRKLRKKVT